MYHKLVLVGNLGRDPEMRYTPQGTPVTTFPVASSRKYNTADGTQKEETLWFRVTVWGKQAETVNQYLQKGRQVLVEGALVGDEKGGPRIWTANDGTARASFEVRAQTVRFLGKREAVAAPGATPSPEVAAAVEEPSGVEDLPF